MIDTSAMQAHDNAIAVACSHPGLTWQQIAAIQAGIPFATPAIAAAAIAAANAPGGGAPGGPARIPSQAELTAAASSTQEARALVASLTKALGL